MSQALNRVWKRDDEVQNLRHFQFIWCGNWQMNGWTMAVLPHMCIGFPALLMEQTIMTSYNDVMRISHAIEGNIKGECNRARGLWLLLSLLSGCFDTSVKLFTRPQTLYLSCLGAPRVGSISWMYSVFCFSHKHVSRPIWSTLSYYNLVNLMVTRQTTTSSPWTWYRTKHGSQPFGGKLHRWYISLAWCESLPVYLVYLCHPIKCGPVTFLASPGWALHFSILHTKKRIPDLVQQWEL